MELALHTALLVGRILGDPVVHEDQDADGCGYGSPSEITDRPPAVFPGGVGNTHGDPAAFASLLGDVTEKLFGPLPDETWIYPGHGNDTTLGAERPHLQEWRDRGW